MKSIRILGIGALLAAMGAAPMLALPATSSLANETAGQYLDDSTITARVKSALIGDPQVKAHQINVKTYDGVVQLNGFVDNRQMIGKAAQDANEVPGVKRIENNLSVKQ